MHPEEHLLAELERTWVDDRPEHTGRAECGVAHRALGVQVVTAPEEPRRHLPPVLRLRDLALRELRRVVPALDAVLEVGVGEVVALLPEVLRGVPTLEDVLVDHGVGAELPGVRRRSGREVAVMPVRVAVAGPMTLRVLL